MDPYRVLSAPGREELDRLIPIFYGQLHRIAEACLRREPRHHHTLQATALVHEAYLRLAEHGPREYNGQLHLFGVAARVMRQVLVDHARSRNAVKRGADVEIPFAWPLDPSQHRSRIVTALDDSLRALAQEDESSAWMVELRFFGGLTTREIAALTGLPPHAVRRRLRAAQAWLRREIESDANIRGRPEW
jgi:RNA polymerase sigma-70 factor, ECF subfamily